MAEIGILCNKGLRSLRLGDRDYLNIDGGESLPRGPWRGADSGARGRAGDWIRQMVHPVKVDLSKLCLTGSTGEDGLIMIDGGQRLSAVEYEHVVMAIEHQLTCHC